MLCGPRTSYRSVQYRAVSMNSIQRNPQGLQFITVPDIVTLSAVSFTNPLSFSTDMKWMESGADPYTLCSSPAPLPLPSRAERPEGKEGINCLGSGGDLPNTMRGQLQAASPQSSPKRSSTGIHRPFATG